MWKWPRLRAHGFHCWSSLSWLLLSEYSADRFVRSFARWHRFKESVKSVLDTSRDGAVANRAPSTTSAPSWAPRGRRALLRLVTGARCTVWRYYRLWVTVHVVLFSQNKPSSDSLDGCIAVVKWDTTVEVSREYKAEKLGVSSSLCRFPVEKHGMLVSPPGLRPG